VRLKSNIQRLENISLKSADKRLADALLHYARTFGKQHDNGEIVIDVPLTHQTLANILNIARETVSHAMLRLQDVGAIRVLPKFHIAVVDMDVLKQQRS
jgi:CRP/FNR family transcriptional regulator